MVANESIRKENLAESVKWKKLVRKAQVRFRQGHENYKNCVRENNAELLWKQELGIRLRPEKVHIAESTRD